MHLMVSEQASTKLLPHACPAEWTTERVCSVSSEEERRGRRQYKIVVWAFEVQAIYGVFGRLPNLDEAFPLPATCHKHPFPRNHLPWSRPNPSSHWHLGQIVQKIWLSNDCSLYQISQAVDRNRMGMRC